MNKNLNDELAMMEAAGGEGVVLGFEAIEDANDMTDENGDIRVLDWLAAECWMAVTNKSIDMSKVSSSLGNGAVDSFGELQEDVRQRWIDGVLHVLSLADCIRDGRRADGTWVE